LLIDFTITYDFKYKDSMTTINEIIDLVQTTTGHPLNRDEGIQFGTQDRSVQRVTVSWMATPEAIQSAGTAGHELLIAHESVYYPYDVLNIQNPPPDWREWKVNKQRTELLDKYDLSCLRLHGSVDEICIFDVFAHQLKLGTPVHTAGLIKVFEIPACSLRILIQRVKENLEMDSLRIAGIQDLDQKVSRIGLPWGGLGLFVNVGYQQQLIELNCDVFIAGESDSYGFRFAAEAGIPMIETGHEISENPGLRQFTQFLTQHFPSVDFTFYEVPSIWRIT
jgi:putative NIF3 family GTP cyclohydrolase 1 type 2